MPKAKCAVCEKWKESKNCRNRSSQAYSWLHNFLLERNKIVKQEDLMICNGCWLDVQKMKKTTSEFGSSFNESMDIDTTNSDDYEGGNDGEDDSDISLNNVIFGGSSHNHCVVCLAPTVAGMTVMPRAARLDLLILHHLYVPEGVRSCRSHLLSSNHLNPEESVKIGSDGLLQMALSSDKLPTVVDDLLSLIQEAVGLTRLNFLDPSFSDEDYKAWMGWSKKQFDSMFEKVVPFLRSSPNRDVRTALAIFWIKIKTNLSFRQIGSLFSIPGDGESRRKRAADAFDSIRVCLIQNFVPMHLGVGHITRVEALSHNTSFTNEFFGNEVTIIWDGTYVYMNKSSDHAVNRSTYSGQKSRHLVKFMSLVLPDGYVLETIGPFVGTANDASIARQILETRDELIQWCDGDATFIVDRGFRDVIESFVEMGYDVKMPIYLQKHQKQHSTYEANESRLVTKVRWTVESYHSRLKKWLFLSERVDNQFLPKLNDIVRIISAALNAFRGPIVPNYVHDHCAAVAHKMRIQATRQNSLAARIEAGDIVARSRWRKIDDAELDFPSMDLDDLRELFLGPITSNKAEHIPKNILTKMVIMKLRSHQKTTGYYDVIFKVATDRGHSTKLGSNILSALNRSWLGIVNVVQGQER